MKSLIHHLYKAIILVMVVMLGACATTQQNERVARIDPLEPMNRAVFTFNENLDQYLVKPAAEAYKFVMPDAVRRGVTNFFSNIGDIFVAANNLLQGKPKEATSDIGRFLVNSTIGILGLFDVATDIGLDKHAEDFGQTMAFWGVSSGPYVVLPFFGPSTVRDSVGLWVDTKTDVNQQVSDIGARNTLTVLRLTDKRERYLSLSDAVKQASLDPYTFTRDAYLQKRLNDIYDGNPPMLDDFDDPEQPAPMVAPNRPSASPAVPAKSAAPEAKP